jgi:membrane protein DedA with SNARE-associated domain
MTTLLTSMLHFPLAFLISLDALRSALNSFGYAAVVLFIMIESSGIPFPGETMLLLAAFYAAVDQHLQIPLVIACAAFGAIVGDNIGFQVGRTGGRAFVHRFGKYLFLKPEHLDKAEVFFAKHGNKTVFLGRFVAVLRAWAAFLAGVNGMKWTVFLLYNAAGGIIWAIVYGLLGFYAGRIFHNNFSAVERLGTYFGWIGTLIIITAVGVLYLLYRRRRKQSHVKPEPQNSLDVLPSSESTATSVPEETVLPEESK